MQATTAAEALTEITGDEQQFGRYRLLCRVAAGGMANLYLALGAVLGALLLINRWLPLGPAIEALRASPVQFLLVGWLTQFIIGVAWWVRAMRGKA